jgi:hypothetical protein
VLIPTVHRVILIGCQETALARTRLSTSRQRGSCGVEWLIKHSRIIIHFPYSPAVGGLIKMASPSPPSGAMGNNSNLFQCGTCSQSFTRIDHLGRHVRSRTLVLGPSLATRLTDLGRYTGKALQMLSVQQAIRSRVRGLSESLTSPLTRIVTFYHGTRPSTTRKERSPRPSDDAMVRMSRRHVRRRHAKPAPWIICVATMRSPVVGVRGEGSRATCRVGPATSSRNLRI